MTRNTLAEESELVRCHSSHCNPDPDSQSSKQSLSKAMINSDGPNVCLVESRQFSRDRAHVTSLKVPRESKIRLSVIR